MASGSSEIAKVLLKDVSVCPQVKIVLVGNISEICRIHNLTTVTVEFTVIYVWNRFKRGAKMKVICSKGK